MAINSQVNTTGETPRTATSDGRRYRSDPNRGPPRDGAFGDHSFALCLSHDVDRVHKTYQSVYQAMRRLDPIHLSELVSRERPYWQFEEIMALEERLGVRSSFYFLSEQHLLTEKPITSWFRPINWIRYTGHYRVDDPSIAAVIRSLDENGWEVGLHGSLDSSTDTQRLAWEKQLLEEILGHTILGGRQHYLRLQRPETWKRHQDIGLKYDSSLGSSTTYGFDHGYGVIRPFDDEFMCFPLTVMETTLLEQHSSVAAAKEAIDALIAEATREQAIMTALWHPRLFNEQEFPGYRELYRYLIIRSQEAGAWIGPIDQAYQRMVAELRSSA